MDTQDAPFEVAIVSGSYGAGHDAVAAELALRFEDRGHRVRRLDIAEELPLRLGVIVRWLYFTQLRLCPQTWGTTLRCLARDGWAARGTRWLLGVLGGRLIRHVDGAHLVISTHPFASQSLGEARRRRTLDASVVTYLTDASVHRLWVHPDVDLHLAIHELTAAAARDLGGTASVARPVVSAATGRPAIGWTPPWPADRPAALIVGGSLGVGELEASAHDLLAIGLVTPVVACGTNERLRERLASVSGVVALGWRDDLQTLIGAAACVVQNAGGMTSLESLAAGTPTVTYRPIPGHGVTNARALDRAGLVPWPSTIDELDAAVARALVSRDSFALPRTAPSALDVLASHGLLSAPELLEAS